MNEKPTHLDLFSGIGGFALAAGWAGFETIGFCDNEPYAQAVLKKHWPDVPIHPDIREVRGDLYAGVTLLTGGFPCQPFSVAGKQRGKTDDRYLWPEMLRVIREARPAWIIGENVAGIVNMALDQVHTDLEAEGYEVETLIIPACAVDAPHRRDRVWIIARNLADSVSLPKGSAHGKDQRDRKRGWKEPCISEWNKVGSDTTNSSKDVANPKLLRLECSGNERGIRKTLLSSSIKGRKSSQAAKIFSSSHGAGRGNGQSLEANWFPEPNVGRVAHGIPNRTHRLKGLGNAIVPQVAYQIIKGIRELL